MLRCWSQPIEPAIDLVFQASLTIAYKLHAEPREPVMDQSKRTAALALAAGALAVAGAAQAQVRLPGRGKPADKGAMDHSKMATGADVSLSPAEINVVTTLSQCSMAAEQCLSLCIEQMAVGDMTMGECARSVRDVIALCETSKTLIQARSPLSKEHLALCRKACTACKKTCEPHAMHHAACRACAQACDTAIAAINVVLV
jgi:Cys-rich four helix bundle protein (predicted Tat secretion target)